MLLSFGKVCDIPNSEKDNVILMVSGFEENEFHKNWPSPLKRNELIQTEFEEVIYSLERKYKVWSMPTFGYIYEKTSDYVDEDFHAFLRFLHEQKIQKIFAIEIGDIVDESLCAFLKRIENATQIKSYVMHNAMRQLKKGTVKWYYPRTASECEYDKDDIILERNIRDITADKIFRKYEQILGEPVNGLPVFEVYPGMFTAEEKPKEKGMKNNGKNQKRPENVGGYYRR